MIKWRDPIKELPYSNEFVLCCCERPSKYDDPLTKSAFYFSGATIKSKHLPPYVYYPIKPVGSDSPLLAVSFMTEDLIDSKSKEFVILRWTSLLDLLDQSLIVKIMKTCPELKRRDKGKDKDD